MYRKILFFVISLFFATSAFTAFSQEREDTTYTFRFMPRKDIFYVPGEGNGNELMRLLECVKSNKSDIMDGKLPLYVDGYCNSLDSEAANLATAKVRSNRVKSELITRVGIKEVCFVTRNHATDGDFVIVRITIPADTLSVHVSEPVVSDADTLATQKCTEEEQSAEERCEEALQPAEEETEPVAQQKSEPDSQSESADWEKYSFSVRANLLRWATLTPDLGVEWRINRLWGVTVNGSWTSWSWKNKERRYALWEVAPEVRRYLGKESDWYVGVMFKAGQFNYKLSDLGRQGNLFGGGVTGGYILDLNKKLSLDFNIGLGYLNADIDKYEVIEGVRVRSSSEKKNWVGPVNTGVTLVWKIF